MYFDTASAVSFRQQHSDSGCINTELLSPLDKDLGPEAFLSHSSLALHMARFPEAERRRLHKMICMQCYARNAMRATRCRKCGSKELRTKAKEARKE